MLVYVGILLIIVDGRKESPTKRRGAELYMKKHNEEMHKWLAWSVYFNEKESKANSSTSRKKSHINNCTIA